MAEQTRKSRQGIEAELIRLLEDMTSDWDLDFSGGINSDTHLIGDLGFESIDVVQLVSSIEEAFNRKDLPFEKVLMKDGYYVQEIPLSALVDFLSEHLNKMNSSSNP